MNILEAEINNKHRLTLETGLYLLAGALALTLRLLYLGVAPLGDVESGWALSALKAIGQGSAPGAAFGTQPGYTFLTAATFWLLGATDFTARLWPGLAGASLALLPLLFRSQLGRRAALVLAFALACDPGLVVVSRQAGGPMLALAAVLWTLGFWHTHRPSAAGAAAGLALLSGPEAWFGLACIGLTSLGLRLINRYLPGFMPDPTSSGREPEAVLESGAIREESLPEDKLDVSSTAGPSVDKINRSLSALLPTDWRIALGSCILVILLLGTFLLRRPEGLAAAFSGLTGFISSWNGGTNSSAGLAIFALLSFQPFAILFAVVGLVRWIVRRFRPAVQPDEDMYQPWLWFAIIISLLLTLLYPGRQISTLIWTIAPLWASAALGLAPYLPWPERASHLWTDPASHDLEPEGYLITHPAMVLLQAGLTLLLASLLWVWLTSTEALAPVNSMPLQWIRPVILIGLIALTLLTSVLVALGWSWPVGRDGLVWGLVASYAIYATSMLWGATFLRPNQPQELWGLPSGPGQVRLFQQTLHQLSIRSTGMPTMIEVVSTVDSPSVRWALRDFARIRYTSQPPVGEHTEVLVTRREETLPGLDVAYRGQDFVWWVYPGWLGPLPPNLVTWFAYRQAPTQYEYLILWARNDLFSSTNP